MDLNRIGLDIAEISANINNFNVANQIIHICKSACKHNRTDIFELLLAHNIFNKFNILIGTFNEFIEIAIEHRHLRMLTFLINEVPIIRDMHCINRSTLLEVWIDTAIRHSEHQDADLDILKYLAGMCRIENAPIVIRAVARMIDSTDRIRLSRFQESGVERFQKQAVVKYGTRKFGSLVHRPKDMQVRTVNTNALKIMAETISRTISLRTDANSAAYIFEPIRDSITTANDLCIGVLMVNFAYGDHLQFRRDIPHISQNQSVVEYERQRAEVIGVLRMYLPSVIERQVANYVCIYYSY